MGIVINAIAGILFGFGLLISGMANPAKVLNFLDVAGSWDPSLAFVMAAAVAVTFVGYRFAFRRPTPLLSDRFYLPSARDIDRPLLLGAAIFGVGWGLSGLCPGPALVSLPLLAKGVIAFVPAMIFGAVVARLLKTRNEEQSVGNAAEAVHPST
jgi:uncharacterized membrane protein YedE/YeeE